MPGLLSWVVMVIRGSKYEASDVVPGPGPNIRHPLFGFSFPPPGPAGPVPRLHRYYEGAAISCRPSRRASFPSLGGTAGPHVVFALRRTSASPRSGAAHPVAPAGISPRRRQDLPSSWAISIVRLHVFSPTPAGLLTPDHYGAAAWPLDPQVQRLPRLVFRRSIARFRTRCPRFAGRITPTPRKTRFRLLLRLYRMGFPPTRFR